MNGIGVFAFVKNECDFIKRFVEHNLKIADEMTVIDNGSTDGTIEILEGYKDRLNLVLDASGFGKKGRICLEWMSKSTADILIPLDADELVVFDNGSQVANDPERLKRHISEELKVEKNERFRIRRTFTKHPEAEGWWGVSPSNKMAFSKEGLVGLDCGFHHGRMEKNANPRQCDVSYLHCRFRSKEAWEKSTIQKLKARLGRKWEDPEVLKNYKGPSFHCAQEYIIYKTTGRWHRVGKHIFDKTLLG